MVNNSRGKDDDGTEDAKKRKKGSIELEVHSEILHTTDPDVVSSTSIPLSTQASALKAKPDIPLKHRLKEVSSTNLEILPIQGTLFIELESCSSVLSLLRVLTVCWVSSFYFSSLRI